MAYDWMASALCAQVGPGFFHLDGSGGGYEEGKKICARCPVTEACAAHAQALESNHTHAHRYGLWGGQVPRRRAREREKASRRETHDLILRLHDRGGMTPDEIAEHASVDVRTVYRVVKQHRAGKAVAA